MRIALILLLSVLLTDVGLAQPFRKVADRNPKVTSTRHEVVAYPEHLAGRKMAGGGVYNPSALTAAHPSYPFGTMLELTAQGTGRSVAVTVTDRGAGQSAALIISEAAMKGLGLRLDDTAMVTVRPWDPTRARKSEPAAAIADRNVSDPDAAASPAVETSPAPAPPRQAETRPVPAKPAPSTPARAESNASQSLFAVQLGSYSEKSTARNVAAKLDNAWIQQASMEDRTVYRVFYGRYSERAAADAWQVRLARLGFSGYVRTLSSGN